jgi:hypothetical protein
MAKNGSIAPIHEIPVSALLGGGLIYNDGVFAIADYVGKAAGFRECQAALAKLLAQKIAVWPVHRSISSGIAASNFKGGVCN